MRTSRPRTAGKTLLAIVSLGACLLAADSLPAQVTHTFSNVIELGDGRVAAADATLIDDATVSFALMAPGLDLEWVEIRDREPGGTLLATTRSTGGGRAPHLQLIGMGEVLNESGGEGVTIGLEDFLVELTLHAPGGGLGRAADAGVVVVGFTDGQSTSFPILQPDTADGAAITMVPMDDDGVFAGEAGEDAPVAAAPAGGERSGAAVARETPPTVAPAPQPVPPPVAAQARPVQPPAPAPRPAASGPGPPTGPVAQSGPGAPPGPGVPPGPGTAPGSGAPGAPAASAVAGSDWLASATALRGRLGERFEFRCPAGGAAGRGPFGTEIYADHSSVCTAAVHAGRVTFASGGSVTIEIRAGQDSYPGSPGQGGVTSSAASAWPGSFAFVR